MTFQQHTTYEQSLKLKELGMPQHGEHGWFWNANNDEHFVQCDEWMRNLKLEGADCEAIAFTRQELEDYLRQSYLVMYLPFETVVEGFGLQKVDRQEIQLWERPFVDDFNRDPEIAVGSLVHFRCAGSDPFPVIFDAVVWSLEQMKPTA